jgi:predicted amidohydrolase YtcJ
MKSAHIICNAQVRTMAASGSACDAIAWRDGRLLAVGARADVARIAGPDARVWDAAGATVLPGFIDAHHHPSVVALFGGRVRLAPPSVSDIASLQRALQTAACDLGPGQWLVATDWNEALLAERRPPTRRELDDAVPDHPLLALHYSCHRAVANSRALALAQIGRDTPDPSGGAIGRGRNGVPNGLLIERALSRVESLARASLLARDGQGFLARLGQHHRALVAAGITRIVDATVPGDVAALYREAQRRGLLIVPTVMMPVSTAGYLEAPFDVLDGPVTGQADGALLVVGPVKLICDGAPACAMCLGWWQTVVVFARSCLLSWRLGSAEPLRTTLSVQPRVGAKIRTGIRIYRRDEAQAMVRAATEHGFAVATHAIGNDAVDVALSAYEAVGAAALGRAGLPRIEHASFLDRELVARIAGIGAAVVAQPHFLSLPAYSAAAPIPRLRNAPLRWLLEAGVKVAGSSDFPVAGFDPLDGIRSAIGRRTARGHVYEPDQRIELDDALAMYTRVAAEVCGCLAECGTLEPGKRADLVVLDGPLGPGTLAAARVRATIIGGELVFGALARTDAHA